MKYGVFTVCMPEFSVEEGIEKLAEWGYDGVEWRVVNQSPSADGKPGFWAGNRCTISEDEVLEKAEEVRKRCHDAGIEILSIASYLNCGQPERVERVFEAAVKMGTSRIRVGAARYNGTQDYRRLLETTIEGYGKIEKLARKHGVRALAETHHGTIIASASAAYRLVSHFDPRYVGVIHDAGNMVAEGFENYQMAFELLGEYLAEVHVKNTGWERGETGPNGQQLWRHGWAGMKEGVVDWAVLMKALKSVGYDGWLSIEDFSGQRPTEEKLPGDLSYLRQLEASA